MSKIVDISGRRIATRITPAELFHHCRAYWVCGAISQNAYFLGNILLCIFQQEDSRIIRVTKKELHDVFTRHTQGAVMTGKISRDHLEFTLAMQGLHCELGIMSAKDPDEFDAPDAEKRHFTRSPESRRSFYDDETPIFFRLPRESNTEFAEKVQSVWNEKLVGVRPITITL